MAIVYCSENQAVSGVMLVLQWPNVPVSVCKEDIESAKRIYQSIVQQK